MRRNLRQRLLKVASSAKPDPRAAGPNSWFPFYAGYSASFVLEAFQALEVTRGMYVLDPWNGSGTTTTIADRLGCHAIGFDINPVAVVAASARLVRPEDALHSEGLAAEILNVAERFKECADKDPLQMWLSRRLTQRYRAIESAILQILATRDGSILDPRDTAPPPYAAFMLLCLIRTAKWFARTAPKSNPTWMTPGSKGDGLVSTFDNRFKATVKMSAAELQEELQVGSQLPTRSYVAYADCRALPLNSNSIDVVVSSPPYCTRIDYFKATSLELAALGIGEASETYRRLRETAMGTNLVRGQCPSAHLPKKIARLLEKIENHPSHASRRYYLKNYLQYFCDASSAIGEIERVLKPGGTALLVVQSSYYKEIEICLGDLFSSLGQLHGLRSTIAARYPVHRSLASINRNAAIYVQDRKYTEDVVSLVKR